MDPERWAEVKKLFNEALGRDAKQRAEFLDEACGHDKALRDEIASLLESHEPTSRTRLIDTLPDAADARAVDLAEGITGQRLGPYQIMREIGRGGMATVYLATRADDQFRKRVAIKIVNSAPGGKEIVQRFRHERQTLAALDHPNIVRLLDGGSTEQGLPYLVMEYVEGVSIDEYCDSRRLAISERLQLFRIVCAAVQYAHQNLVIHRDLKPGNILVTSDGVTKLLDFGIAKLLNPELGGQSLLLTRASVRLLTPQYASPEQIRGEALTTTTDIYSLGVVLYELLTGHQPYRLRSHTPLEIERAICEQEPEKPSTIVTRMESTPTADQSGAKTLTPELVSLTREGKPERLRRRLSGDLDNIVLMALRKEPARRYASVEQFSADIQHHLEGRPVNARPATLLYRSSKFIRRNRTAVAAAAAILLALIAGLVVASWEAHVAQTERARAEKRFQDVRTLATSMLFEPYNAIEKLPGSTPARELLVRRALEYVNGLAEEARGDPSLQLELADAYARIGDIQWNRYYANLGDERGALENQQKALRIREEVAAIKPRNSAAQAAVARSCLAVGDLLVASGNLRAGLDYYRRALGIRERLVAADESNRRTRAEVAVAHQRIGDALGNPKMPNIGDFQGALDHYRKMQTIFEQLLREQPSDLEARHSVAIGYEKLGRIEAAHGNATRALELYRKELSGFQEVASAQPANAQYRRDVAIAYGNIGTTLQEMGQFVAASESFDHALQIDEELFAIDPKNASAFYDLQHLLQTMSSAAAKARAPARLRALTRRLLEIQKGWADRPGATAADLNEYAWSLLTCEPRDLRQPAAALAYAKRAVEMSGGNEANVLDTLAMAYDANGDTNHAIELDERAIRLATDDQTRAAIQENLKLLRAKSESYASGPSSH